MHLRLWLAEQVALLVDAASLAGAPWISYYARALGAQIGRDADLHTLPPVTGMLSIGSQAAIEPETDLAGYWVDGDVLRIGHVHIGADSKIGSRSTLLGGAHIGNGAQLEPGAAVSEAVPAGERWAGSPATRVGSAKESWPAERPINSRRWLALFAAGSIAMTGIPALAIGLGALLLGAAIGDADTLGVALLRAAIMMPLAVVAGGVFYALLVIGSVRALGVGLREGYYPVRSRIGWQVWMTERLLDGARDVLFPVFASLFTPVWLRLLGARVGPGVEASTVLLIPALTTIAPDAFLADDTMVACYDLGGGWLHIAPAKVGRRAFLGNSGMAGPGRTVPRNGLVAVLSSTPRKAKRGSSWLGNPAALVTTVAKWLLVGRITATEHPLWSSFIWRNEVSDSFVEIVARPWFAAKAAGTPALAVWLRTLGAKIGRGVWCESYWLPEADLVNLGDGATVNRGCVVQTHLFHDRIMQLDTVLMASGSTLGPHSVILPAASVDEGSTVGPASLVMRGERVPTGSLWSGNPISPWRSPPWNS